MALKPLRKISPEGSDIAYFMFEAAEAGHVVVDASGGGTGKPGDDDNRAKLPDALSDVPLGILGTTVVDIDLSKCCHYGRFHSDEVPLCSPVNIFTDGYVYTNAVDSGVISTIVASDPAHWLVGGDLTNTVNASTAIGKFRGKADADGYVGVNINL